MFEKEKFYLHYDFAPYYYYSNEKCDKKKKKRFSHELMTWVSFSLIDFSFLCHYMSYR